MGMYTELYITCRLNEELPDDVLSVLQYMFGNASDVPTKLPDHILFTKSCWECIGHTGSYYFVPEPTSNLFFSTVSKNAFITARSDLKNYDGEIENFFDWIMPYVDEPEGQFIGYHRYEENDLPTLIVKTGD